MIQVVSQMFRWLPVVVTVAFFWQTLGIWFRADDFAWLGLRLSIQQPSDLLYVLFAPMAQGTVRFLSERVFFLTFEKLFGLNAFAFRVAILAIQAASSVLLAAVTRRLTGSERAGVLAAIFWVVQGGLADAMGWISASNQVFCGLFILAAFLAFLDRRMIWCWIIFLLGFGTLETMVVFPALLLAYTVLLDRERIRQTLPFWIPSLVFTWLRLGVFARIHQDSTYSMHFAPGDLWATFNYYLDMSIGWKMGVIVVAIALYRAVKKDFLPLFALAWLFILLAPVLPLKNHWLYYYMAAPGMALAFLFATVVDDLTRRKVLGISAAIVLTVSFVHIQSRQSIDILNWYQDRATSTRQLIEGMASASSTHPGKTILLAGVSSELFGHAMAHDPFRLFGIPRPLLAPGEEKVHIPSGAGAIDDWMLPIPIAKRLFRQGNVLVYELKGDQLVDVTAQRQKQIDQLKDEFTSQVKLGDPAYEGQLREGWYEIESGARWMSGKSAIVLSIPSYAGRISITGYAPGVVLKDGPVDLTVRADGMTLGRKKLQISDTSFELSYVLPAEIRGRPETRIELESSRSIHVPADARTLGLIFSSIRAE